MADDAKVAPAGGGIRVDMRAVPPLGTVFFEADLGGRAVSAFAIRTVEGPARCYVNACPHVPVYGLDFGDGHVVDPRDGRIVCANHGARFEPTDGVCVDGPCVGAALQAWPCEEVDGWLTVAPQDEPEGWPDGLD